MDIRCLAAALKPFLAPSSSAFLAEAQKPLLVLEKEADLELVARWGQLITSSPPHLASSPPRLAPSSHLPVSPPHLLRLDCKYGEKQGAG